MTHSTQMIRVSLILLSLVVIILFLGKSLNPFTPSMFPFHDSSQGARIAEFAFNIKSLQLPPRMAPHFENNMSYPAFNFYAPFSYWITSFLHLAGIPIIGSLKLSFLGAIIIGFLGMYFLSRRFFSFMSSLGAGIMYVTGVYFAVDIFVRGNLAEVWYMALLPLTFYTLHENQERQSRLFFIMTSLLISFILTVHTIFSPVTLFLILATILLQEKKLLNGFALLIGLGLSSYFVIPALLESSLTNAKEVAMQTHYIDHFVCIGQLWKSIWGFAGSAPGCDADGMSFMVGKIQLVAAALGIGYFIIKLKQDKKTSYLIPFLFLAIFLGSLFMTLYESKFIWDTLSPFLGIFQFPWRFLTLTTFGAAFFSGYFFESIKKIAPIQIGGAFIIGVICFYSLYSHAKYFYRPVISENNYKTSYLSHRFIEQEAAKKLPEYFPKTGVFDVWQKNKIVPTIQLVKNDPYVKKLSTDHSVTLPLLYLPYWRIMINGKPYVPQTFDSYTRPVIKLDKPSEIVAVYEQTLVEKLGNSMTLISFVFLLVVVYTRTWSKLKKAKI